MPRLGKRQAITMTISEKKEVKEQKEKYFKVFKKSWCWVNDINMLNIHMGNYDSLKYQETGQ